MTHVFVWTVKDVVTLCVSAIFMLPAVLWFGYIILCELLKRRGKK